MWLKGGRSMGSSALIGTFALVAIEYASNGGSLTVRPALDPTFHARLERSPCLGSCPSYRIDIDAEGHVSFVGRPGGRGQSVSCQGTRRWSVNLAAVRLLRAQIEASGFFGLRPAYRAAITDQPQSTVTVSYGGRTKTVVDYAGGLVGTPIAMTSIERDIDVAADAQRCAAISRL